MPNTSGSFGAQKYDGKEGMKSGESSETDAAARSAKELLNKGSKVHADGFPNSPPQGNPESDSYGHRSIPGSK